MMTLDEGAERLHRLTKELLRRYQFRDWNQVCCYGISISQSHILDVLAEEGDLTMQQLARQMFAAWKDVLGLSEKENERAVADIATRFGKVPSNVRAL